MSDSLSPNPSPSKSLYCLGLYGNLSPDWSQLHQIDQNSITTINAVVISNTIAIAVFGLLPILLESIAVNPLSIVVRPTILIVIWTSESVKDGTTFVGVARIDVVRKAVVLIVITTLNKEVRNSCTAGQSSSGPVGLSPNHPCRHLPIVLRGSAWHQCDRRWSRSASA